MTFTITEADLKLIVSALNHHASTLENLANDVASSKAWGEPWRTQWLETAKAERLLIIRVLT